MPEEMVSAETPEVAEPVEQETGAEDQEVATPESLEPEHQKNDADAAFAEARRARQAAEQDAADARAELAELKAQIEARDNAINRLTGNDLVAALAEASGLSEDEINAEMEAAQESAQKDLQIQNLQDELQDIKVQRMMADDLKEIQRVDPSVKDLTDLGEGYVDYVRAGLDPVRAYWALKAEEGANHREPPKPAGKVATGTAEKDYFTDAEIDAMSPEQLAKNHKKILASWERNAK